MLNTMLIADAVEDVPKGPVLMSHVTKPDSVVREGCMHLIRYGRQHTAKKISRHRLGNLGLQLGKYCFAGTFHSHKQIEFAFFGTDFSKFYVQIANRIMFKLLLFGAFTLYYQGQPFTGAVNGFSAAKALERDPWTGKPLYSDIPKLESVPPRSLGAARSEYKSMLQNIELYTKEQIAEFAKNHGFSEFPTKVPDMTHYKRVGQDGKIRKEGLQLRLDPPQDGTNYHHMHIERGNDAYNIQFKR